MHKKQLMILIWNMGIGGIQKRVKDVIIELTNDPKYQDTHVHLVVKFEQPSFFTQELLEKSNSQRLTLSYFTDSYQHSKSYPSFIWVIKKYLEIKPDVLLTFLDHLSVLAVFIKYFAFWHDCKVILNEGVLTSRYIRLNRGRASIFWMTVIRIFYRFADSIIVPSKAVKNDLSQFFGVPSAKITVIPNWTLFKKNHRSPQKKYDLAYVGRFEDEKNPLLFLDVVKNIHAKAPHLKACMVGGGKLEPEIKRYITQHSLGRTLEMVSPLNNMRQVLPKCRLLVVTSKNEGLPNVVLEAGALEIPSICAPFVGVEEVIVDGKTGWIRQDSAEITKLVLHLLKKPNVITRTGIQAEKHISANFSQKNQTAFIKTLIGDEK